MAVGKLMKMMKVRVIDDIVCCSHLLLCKGCQSAEYKIIQNTRMLL